MRKVSEQVSSKIQTVEKIVHYSENNIRQIIRSGDKKKIEQTGIEIMQMIHTCINLFTSVPLDKQNQTDVKILISMSKDFIIENFSMLNVKEILDSFKLASLGKTDASLQTYHGKFTIDMLSDVLNSYLKYRNRIICSFNDKLKAEKLQQEQQDKEEKNKQARNQVIQLFNDLKEQYHETGEFDESKIKPFQAKILIETGMIDFPEDEKREIFEQAKIKVQKNLKQEVQKNIFNPVQLRSIRSMLNDFENGMKNISLKSQIVSEYSKMLIIKSILK